MNRKVVPDSSFILHPSSFPVTYRGSQAVPALPWPRTSTASLAPRQPERQQTAGARRAQLLQQFQRPRQAQLRAGLRRLRQPVEQPLQTLDHLGIGTSGQRSASAASTWPSSLPRLRTARSRTANRRLPRILDEFGDEGGVGCRHRYELLGQEGHGLGGPVGQGPMGGEGAAAVLAAEVGPQRLQFARRRPATSISAPPPDPRPGRWNRRCRKPVVCRPPRTPASARTRGVPPGAAAVRRSSDPTVALSGRCRRWPNACRRG